MLIGPHQDLYFIAARGRDRDGNMQGTPTVKSKVVIFRPVAVAGPIQFLELAAIHYPSAGIPHIQAIQQDVSITLLVDESVEAP